jgi:hypothetical protein
VNGTYPVAFSVDYPDRELNRLTSAPRIFTVIPIAVVLVVRLEPAASSLCQAGRRVFRADG